MAIAQPDTPPTGCYLLELPAELRNYIWCLTLVKSDTVTVDSGTNHRNSTRLHFCISLNSIPAHPYLLETNHQIRSETKPIYFEENKFRFAFYALTGPCIRAFEQWSGTSAKSIRQLEVEHHFEIDGTDPDTCAAVASCTTHWQINIDADQTGKVEIKDKMISNDVPPHVEKCECMLQQMADCWNEHIAGRREEKGSLFAFLHLYVRGARCSLERSIREFVREESRGYANACGQMALPVL